MGLRLYKKESKKTLGQVFLKWFSGQKVEKVNLLKTRLSLKTRQSLFMDLTMTK